MSPRYLNRHGIEIVVERQRPADVTAANSRLRLIQDENISLIMGGAYGHSRLGEWAFGGHWDLSFLIVRFAAGFRIDRLNWPFNSTCPLVCADAISYSTGNVNLLAFGGGSFTVDQKSQCTSMISFRQISGSIDPKKPKDVIILPGPVD